MKFFNKFGSIILDTVVTLTILFGIFYMANEINSMSSTIASNKKERTEAIANLNLRIDKLEKKVDQMISDEHDLKNALIAE